MDNSIIASIVSMAVLAIFFASVLAFAHSKLRVEEDPKVDEILHLLPGSNCGACGSLSCHDFAEHIVKDGTDPARCRVMHEDHRKKIYEITGKEETAVFPKTALVHCAADWGKKRSRAIYKGVRTCGAANLVPTGGMDCEYGCLGYGDCSMVCPFDAMKMENGLPRVDPSKCTGCGKCVEACPRDIISVEERKYDKIFHVACSSHDNMVRTRKVCDVGCIACGICVKLSQGVFFQMENNLSKVRYSKQGDPEKVGAVQAKCPTKVIKEI